MSWDAFQREMLDALGYRVYGLAGAEPPPATDPAALTPLQRAVLRAAGGRDAAAPAALLTAAASLRANPAAKRALWPQLRALRRGGGG